MPLSPLLHNTADCIDLQASPHYSAVAMRVCFAYSSAKQHVYLPIINYGTLNMNENIDMDTNICSGGKILYKWSFVEA